MFRRLAFSILAIFVLAVAPLRADQCEDFESSLDAANEAISNQYIEIHYVLCVIEFYESGGNSPFAVEMNNANIARYEIRLEEEELRLVHMEIDRIMIIVDMGVAGCL